MTANATIAPGSAIGFSTLEQEVVVDELRLSGELPPWLQGRCSVPAPRSWRWAGSACATGSTVWRCCTGSRSRDGPVSYGNRFLETAPAELPRTTARSYYGEFATDPCRSLFKRVQTHVLAAEILSDNANINVMRLGERFIAMTETPMPVQFDPTRWQPTGVLTRSPGQLTTAHPHSDRATGSMLNYAAKLGPAATATGSSCSADRDARASTEPGSSAAGGPASRPICTRSGYTGDGFVLAEFPLVVNPLRAGVSAGALTSRITSWKPELGTRLHLFDRRR